MKKFYSAIGDDISQEKVSEMYIAIKKAVLGIKEPTVRAVMSFLMLTGARIKEVIPNERYYSAVLIKHIKPNANGVLRLPLTEKKRGWKMGEERNAIIYDYDLFATVMDYLVNHRLNWNSPYLKRTLFNPLNFKRFLYLTANPPTRIGEVGMTMKGYNFQKKFYKKYGWVFLPKSKVETMRKIKLEEMRCEKIKDKEEKEKCFNKKLKRLKKKLLNEKKIYNEIRSKKIFSKKWYINDVLFPVAYDSLIKVLAKIKIKAKLINIQENRFEDGERGLYTHIGREYLVNVWLRNMRLNEYEIARVLNWASVDNINFYLRRDAEIVEDIANRIGLKFVVPKQDSKRLEEVARKVHNKAVKDV